MYDLIPTPTPSLLPLLKIIGIRIPSLCLRNQKPSNNRTKNIAGKEDPKNIRKPDDCRARKIVEEKS
jgi:hypothetical protein